MWLIVGLGNPGDEYRGTRHNVGFVALDLLAERARAEFSDRKFKGRVARGQVAGRDCMLLKPQTYMNFAGEAVGRAQSFLKVPTSEIIVLHDDLDLEIGRLKLKQGGGHGGHNGLRSMIDHLPDPGFIRVRIGIGRPPPRWDAADYVLSRFAPHERDPMEKAVVEAANATEAIIRDGLRLAMNVYNRPPAPDQDQAAD